MLPTPRAEMRAAAAAGPVRLTCDGVEVTQSIQDMPGHTVPLVARKRSVVRVYLSAGSAVTMTIRGVLWARRASPFGRWRLVPSTGTATIDPADNGNLRAKRENEAKSLNFVLPASICAAGKVEVRLVSVVRVPPFGLLVPPANARRSVKFIASAPLRVRIVGIRYQAPPSPATIEPSALDFTLIRSWLGRAYPVAAVEWSQVTVAAPQPWPFDAGTINAFIRGIRATDIIGGVDARTHYYGLVADGHGGFFMRGLASGIPTTPDPSTVASGPTGLDDWGWDFDGSYGDWYTGHELGHTFGRFHAEFCGAVGGAPYPFTNGQLSNADGAFVGFDTGDSAQHIPMRALPGVTWHDVMTYCSFQWLSSFNYTNIRDRLNQEDALPAGMPAPSAVRARRARGSAMPGSETIHVVARVNLTSASGKIQHVTPQPVAASGSLAPVEKAGARKKGSADKPNLSLRAYDRDGKLLAAYRVDLIPDACRDPNDDDTGTVDAFLPQERSTARLELVLNGNVVDGFSPGPPARAVKKVRVAKSPATRAAVRGVGEGASAESPDPVITWGDGASAPRARRAARAAADGPDATYTVQISTDDGKTWQTVGFGLREPQVAIDHNLLHEAEKIRVRITSTDGFRSATVEKEFKASELT